MMAIFLLVLGALLLGMIIGGAAVVTYIASRSVDFWR